MSVYVVKPEHENHAEPATAWILLDGAWIEEQPAIAQVDLASGEQLSKLPMSESNSQWLSGSGKRCRHSLVFKYLDQRDETFYFQVGSERIPIDRSTAATHEWQRLGLVSSLNVTHPSRPPLSFCYYSGIRARILHQMTDEDAVFSNYHEFLSEEAKFINGNNFERMKQAWAIPRP